MVQLIERTVRSENYRFPNRPIYLVGESIGACLALDVAARNPNIDLALILANPASSSGPGYKRWKHLLPALFRIDNISAFIFVNSSLEQLVYSFKLLA